MKQKKRFVTPKLIEEAPLATLTQQQVSNGGAQQQGQQGQQ